MKPFKCFVISIMQTVCITTTQQSIPRSKWNSNSCNANHNAATLSGQSKVMTVSMNNWFDYAAYISNLEFESCDYTIQMTVWEKFGRK